MYKFGINGAGHRTSTLLLPALRNLEVASLVSICDTDYGALDKIKDKHSIRTYFDFKDMLSREKLDFVIAVTLHNVVRKTRLLTYISQHSRGS